MCRYVAYQGPPLLLSDLIYKPENSLVHQATEAMQSLTRINADGFGVGWYAPEISPEPALFKDTTPLWNNYNLGSIASLIRSPAIFAHIRAAKSFDPVTRENCHPFQRGRLLWMHNGDIPGRARLARQVSQAAEDTLLAKIRGNTDSELAFTLFLTHLEDPFSGDPDVEEMAAAMVDTVTDIVAWHREGEDDRPLELNFCVTGGRGLVATRFAVSQEQTPSLFRSIDGGEPGATAVLVASEPLYANGRWQEVPAGSMVIVRPDLSVEECLLAPLLQASGR